MVKVNVRVSVADLFRFWSAWEAGFIAASPWSRPPEIDGREVEALMILTATYRLYELPNYRQFYRIMVRDGQLKLVHENGVEEVIIEAYTPAPELQRFYTVKKLFNVFNSPKESEGQTNVVPFKRTPK